MPQVFSLETYRLIMRTALASGVQFRSFEEADGRGARTILLRHDVDYSLEMAVQIAETNADLGVRATFFLLLRSQVYNLCSDVSLRLAERIDGLGQRLALHTPLPARFADRPFVEQRLRRDFEFVKVDLPRMRPVASWHNPSAEGIDSYLALREVGGLVNAYSTAFCRDIPYYADSNLRHSVHDLMRLVGEEGPLAMQLVLHPLYWVAGGSTMTDVFTRAWPYIIREREHEMRTNRFYATALPNGMPAAVLDTFAASWRCAVEGGAA